LSILGPVVPHIIKGPAVFYDQHRYPLRFVMDDKHGNAKTKGDGVYDKEDDIEYFLMAGLLFIISNIEKPFLQIHKKLLCLCFNCISLAGLFPDMAGCDKLADNTLIYFTARKNMRVPYRKPGKFSQMKMDPLMTKEKFAELEDKLEKLKQKRPQAAAEVKRLAELGDFSENVEYQLAKGRLRGINNAILTLENQLNQAEIIAPIKNDKVQVGSVVTLKTENGMKKYQILGSAEANPQKGIISRNSPIGEALLGHTAGEVIKIRLASGEAEYKILKIE